MWSFRKAINTAASKATKKCVDQSRDRQRTTNKGRLEGGRQSGRLGLEGRIRYG